MVVQQNVVWSPHICNFYNCFLELISFHTVIIGKDTCYDFKLLKFIETCFMSQHRVYPETTPCELQKNGYHASFRSDTLIGTFGEKNIIYNIINY